MYAVKHDFFFKICTLWHHPEFTVRESLSLEVSPYLRKTAASSEAPLLLLQERSGLSPWLFGTLCGVALFAFMFSPALIVDLGDSERRDLLGGALFFGSSFGIVAGCLGPVLRGAVRDLERLRGVLPLSDSDFALARKCLTRTTPGTVLAMLLTGLLLGIAHNYLLSHFPAGTLRCHPVHGHCAAVDHHEPGDAQADHQRIAVLASWCQRQSGPPAAVQAFRIR